MRVILIKGKQKELINLAKLNCSWKELGIILGLSATYIRNELRKEKRFISEEVFEKLSNYLNKDFNRYIIEKRKDNWGRVKGGILSKGNTKNLIKPIEGEDLAELFGIIIGDGHVEKRISGKKIRCYSVVIAGDSRNDKNYLSNYVFRLFKKLFGEPGRLRFSKNKNAIYLKINGKKIVEFIESKGIKSGNKKTNQQSIPKWVLKNDKYLRACLRGLIDTDGCVYYISKNNRNLRISFTSYIPKLLNKVRGSFIRLGFHPSKIIVNKNICLSRKEDVNRFVKEIGFSNDKHLKRIQILINNASMV